MKFDAPIQISFQDDDIRKKRELHIRFRPDFIQDSLQNRIEHFENYINSLIQSIHQLELQCSDRNGMEVVLQFCQNILAYVKSEQIDLKETFVVEITQDVGTGKMPNSDNSIN